jgi:hypothetical protein
LAQPPAGKVFFSAGDLRFSKLYSSNRFFMQVILPMPVICVALFFVAFK